MKGITKSPDPLLAAKKNGLVFHRLIGVPGASWFPSKSLLIVKKGVFIAKAKIRRPDGRFTVKFSEPNGSRNLPGPQARISFAGGNRRDGIKSFFKGPFPAVRGEKEAGVLMLRRLTPSH